MDPQNRPRARVWLLALLAVSFALRLIRINQGLSYDEIFTALEFIFLPWRAIVTYFPQPNNHILNTLLAKLAVTIFGQKEWSLRLPSLILGTITPPLFYFLLSTRVKPRVAFSAAGLLALNYWMVWFSQDARGYAGFILFSGISQILFLDWMESRNRKTLIFYLVSSVIAGYFHLYMTLIFAGQIVYGALLWLSKRKAEQKIAPEKKPLVAQKAVARKKKNLSPPAPAPAPGFLFLLPMIALLLSLALYLPVIQQMIFFFNRNSHNIGGRWLNWFFLKELVHILTGSHHLLVGLAGLLLSLPGFIYLSRKCPGLFWLYLLPAILLILATFVLHIFIYARFLSFLIPFFCLALAQSVEVLSETVGSKYRRIRAGILRPGLMALISLAMLISLARYYALGKQGFKSASQYLQEHYPETPVISYGLAADYFRLYLPQVEVFTVNQSLKAGKLRGKMVVASFPSNWTAHNKMMIAQVCRPEKVWPSAGDEDCAVYLYNCLNQGHGNGSE